MLTLHSVGHLRARITIAYFCLSALDLLGVLNPDHEGETPSSKSGSKVRITHEEIDGWETWIWSLQHREH